MNKTIKLAIFTLILTVLANIAFAQTPTTAEGWLKLGNTQYDQKQFEAATKSYTECINLLSNSTCYFNRGVTYRMLKGKEQQAISDLSKAIQLNVNYEDAYIHRGLTYHSLNKNQESIDDYTKAIQINPNKANTYLNRAISYYYLGKKQESLSDLSKAIELDPRYGTAYLLRATLYCEQKNSALAKADEQKAIQFGVKVTNPCPVNTETKSAEELSSQAYFYKEKCEYQKAVDDLTKAIELEPKNARYYFERGIAYLYIDGGKAKQDLEKGKEVSNAEINSPDANKNKDPFEVISEASWRANKRIEVTNGLEKLNGRKALEPECNKANNNLTKTNQNSSNSNQNTNSNQLQKTANDWVNLGNENFKSKKFKESIEAYTKCIELSPKANICYANRAVAHFNLENYKQAIADTTKAIEIYPNYDFAYQKRRASYCGLGMIELAEKDEKKIISLGKQPEFKECVNLSAKFTQEEGDVEMTLKNYSAALQKYDQALRIHSNSVTYKKRAAVHCIMGNKTLAKTDEEKVIELGGEIEKPCTANPSQNSINSNQNSKTNQPNLGSSKQTVETSVQNKKPKASLSSEDIDLAKRWSNAGSYQFDIGNYQKAVENQTRSLEIKQDHSTYFKRGVAYDALKQYDKAIADFDQSISLNPNIYWTYYFRAKTHKRNGNYEQSIKDLSRVMELNPKYYFAYHDRAEIYCLLGQKNLAEADEKKVIELGGKVTNPCK